MEFRYRAIDERAPNTQIPPSSSSSTTLPLPLPLSRPLQHLTAINGSVNDTLMTQNALSLTLNNNNDIALARRRLELKAEVERQMMVEMEQSKMSLLSQHQYSSSPFGFSQDFYNNYMGMNPFLMMNHQQQLQLQHHRSSPAEVFGNVAAIQQLTTPPITQSLSEDIKEPVVEDTVSVSTFMLLLSVTCSVFLLINLFFNNGFGILLCQYYKGSVFVMSLEFYIDTIDIICNTCLIG